MNIIFLLQKEVVFYYFGSKLITWMVKIPIYNLRPNYHYKFIKQKFESTVKSFIEEGIEAFATSIGSSVKINIDDVKFESVHGGTGNYTNFVLVPPMKGLPATKN